MLPWDADFYLKCAWIPSHLFSYKYFRLVKRLLWNLESMTQLHARPTLAQNWKANRLHIPKYTNVVCQCVTLYQECRGHCHPPSMPACCSCTVFGVLVNQNYTCYTVLSPFFGNRELKSIRYSIIRSVHV